MAVLINDTKNVNKTLYFSVQKARNLFSELHRRFLKIDYQTIYVSDLVYCYDLKKKKKILNQYSKELLIYTLKQSYKEATFQTHFLFLSQVQNCTFFCQKTCLSSK